MYESIDCHIEFKRTRHKHLYESNCISAFLLCTVHILFAADKVDFLLFLQK